MQDGDAIQSCFSWGARKPPEVGYPEADENGMYRLAVERSWVVTYLPTSESLGNSFRIPMLKYGAKATLESRYFSDLDWCPSRTGLSPLHDIRCSGPLFLGLVRAHLPCSASLHPAARAAACRNLLMASHSPRTPLH